jgi:hypothetical protein
MKLMSHSVANQTRAGKVRWKRGYRLARHGLSAIIPAVSGMVATVGYKSARPERECADASSAVVSQDRVVS